MTNNVVTDNKSLRQYWFFFSGQLISLFGSSIVQFALIWWLTVTATANPAYSDRTGLILGLAFVAGFAPQVVTSLFAGVLVDRWNRKKVIASVDALQALLTVGLMILFYFNVAEIPYVLIIMALRSVAQGFHVPATQAIVPIMVPREKLTKVNSMENLFNSSIFLVGPIFGATLIEVFGVDSMATILWADVITFTIAVIPVLLIHIPDVTAPKRNGEKQQSFKEDLGEGISFIRNQEGLLSLLVTFTVVNVMTSPVMVLIPLIVIDPDLMGGTASMLAIFFAIQQGGSIIASLVLTRRPIFENNAKGVAFGQSTIYFSTLIIIVSVLTSNPNLLFVGAFFAGAAIPLANVPSQTIWQSVVPPELQGRVMSVRMVIAWTLIPLAQLVGGTASDYIGPVGVFGVGVVLGSTILAYAWFMTGLSRVEETLGIKPATTTADKEIEPTETVIAT